MQAKEEEQAQRPLQEEPLLPAHHLWWARQDLDQNAPVLHREKSSLVSVMKRKMRRSKHEMFSWCLKVMDEHLSHICVDLVCPRRLILDVHC